MWHSEVARGPRAPAWAWPQLLSRETGLAQATHHGAQGVAGQEEAGFRVTGTTGDELARIMRADTVTWGKAVAATGFKAD